MLQSIQVSTLPTPHPATSPSLLLTFAGLGSGADALPGARPSFLFSPQNISLLGISVTPSRGKVTIRFSLNSWLAHSPAPAATQERWLDVLSAGAKPKPQPRYCHQLHSHVTLQGWDHGKGLWKRPDSDSNPGLASCLLCDPGQVT